MSTHNHIMSYLGMFTLLAVILILPAVVVAQTITGTLEGTVHDRNGATVPGAEVLIRNVETGQERKLTTSSDGFYVASFLPIGRYTVNVSISGFSPVLKQDIEVSLNQTRVVDF